MQQLESVSSIQANSTVMYQSLLTTRLPSVDRNVASTRPQQGKRDTSWQEVETSILSVLTQIMLAHKMTEICTAVSPHYFWPFYLPFLFNF